MTEAGVIAIFALVSGGGTMLWLFYQLFGLDEIVKKLFNAIKRIFAKAKELNHNAVIQEETDRRTALLNEMKKLGYSIDELTPEELDQLRALLKQEFPVLYEDKE